jgi:hypothetical protein
MKANRVYILSFILAGFVSLFFLRCERNDLFEISNAKFSFSSELKVQYWPDGGTDYIDVPTTGVDWGSNVGSVPAPITFLLINTSSYVVTITSVEFSQSSFNSTITGGTTIAVGSSIDFTMNFYPATYGDYSSQVYIHFYTGDGSSYESEISFTLSGTYVLM